MEADTLRMRGKRPFVFINLKSGEGVEPIANFIIEKGGLAKNAALALRFMSPGFDI
jgi:urease accessory protein